MASGVRNGESLEVVKPKELFKACSGSISYDVRRDGKRFIFSCAAQETQKGRFITVAVEWMRMLKWPGLEAKPQK